MGAGKSKFKEVPLGAPATPLPVEKCIAVPSTATETFLVSKSGDNITDVTKSPEIVIKNQAGDLLYSSKCAPFMKTGGNEATLTNADGKVLGISKFKMGFGAGTTRLLKSKPTFDGQESTDTPYDSKETPMFNFAKMEAKMSYTNTCKYGLYTGADTVEPVYLGKLVSTMGKLVRARGLFKCHAAAAARGCAAHACMCVRRHAHRRRRSAPIAGDRRDAGWHHRRQGLAVGERHDDEAGV
jgi:hypothetical protein